ncbi:MULTISPECIES: transglycosylase family protein [Staphylococcus]|nr:transglycosylase family protein [Staphylococcus saprophyticus]MBC2920209.1 transglycosylase family protein [Staphylococcus saprophyticus]MBC2957497.1 transglycosylase family protein [Staphylococcus saprophyticus]MBC3008381.1 transglycosylase family protein [Staphylococcus saprophyticus]MBC3022528.1 transglycosylase family protein [Staphylococcus saprophyticus]MBC3030481.1 transglycosylase family protein [Staphylococcus saprophyticus]
MKKTVVASTLAVGLGVTGIAAGNSADASEQGVDKAQLAQQAQSNPESLNAAPVQDGAYNINFNYNNTDYSFQSDGQYWTWSYGQGSTNAPAQETAEQPQQVEQPQQTEQASTEQPAQEAAPQTEETQQPQQEATTQTTSSSNESTSNESTSNESSSSEDSEGSSVNVNSHLQAIAQRESGGDLKAVNPSSGAAGKYQFLQSTWDSVAPSEYQGVSPTEAPEAVQDAAAVKLYNTAGASQWVTA